MKILTFLSTLFLIIVLAGCNTDTQQQDNKKNTEDKITKNTQENDKNSSIESSKEKKENKNKEKNKNTLKENTEERTVDNNNEKEESSTESTEEKKHENRNKNNLSNYTSKQIEYARVWYQIANTNNIKHLSIDTLPKGSKIFPSSKGSAKFPKNVIRLTGGDYTTKDIIYSSNGDGTINYYSLSHFKISGKIGKSKSKDQRLERNYQNSVKTIKIKPYNNKEIINLIEKEQYMGNIRQ
ncbi:MAG: hypothetical protein ACTIH2_09110 [Anaerococcus sp.]